MSVLDIANVMLAGGTAALSATAALLFLRSYRRTRERLFVWFAVAFAVLAVNRVALRLAAEATHPPTVFYVIRLASFALLLVAILDKNRAR